MTVTSVDPRTGNEVAVVAQDTTAEQVADICKRAETAGRLFADLLPVRRAEILDEMAASLAASSDELIPLADRESALGITRVTGELARTVAQMQLFATVIRDGHSFEVTIDHTDPGATPPIPDLRRMLVPVGPVAVFGASNFPFAFSAAGGDTASALAAGCAVVVKAHGAHPALDTAVTTILSSVASKHGLKDLVSVIYGRSAGTIAVNDPHIRAVGFTGSEAVGRMLMDQAAARPAPIPVYAEMGSLNPLVVTAGAAQKRASELAAGIASSVLLGHGQFCTKPGLVFLPEGTWGDQLQEALRVALATGDEQVMLSSAIRDGYRHNLRSVQSAPGVLVLVGDANPAGDGATGRPALSTVSTADLSSAALEECFGPATLIVRFVDTAQLIAALEMLPGSLTITLHAEAGEFDTARAIQGVATQQAGRVIYGGFPTGVAVSWAQTHAGPYPASAGLFTSVGATAIRRFQRPVSYQTWPDHLLPEHLQEANPLGLPRRVDGIQQLTS